MQLRKFIWTAIALVAVSGLAALGFFTRDYWLGASASNTDDGPPLASEERTTLELSAQARKNLGLTSKPIVLQNYWRTLQVPGVIVDRPGVSDRGISAPAVGVVARIHAYPGQTVKVGDLLFTLRLNSEYLQHTQTELFKNTRELQLVKEQYDRLEPSVKRGALPEARLIQIDQQLQRLKAVTQAHRQDLLTRGLTPAQINQVTLGNFVSEIGIVAPPVPQDNLFLVSAEPAKAVNVLAYEVQELKTELGQQVQAGQLLCILANHRSLLIEGHSFKREAGHLERAAQNNWPVRVDFDQDATEGWPEREQILTIQHLANTLDKESRTFDFFLPLTNQSKQFVRDRHTFLVWRFRPGQHVRLYLPVEEMKNVVVLPAAALVREGPEAYVFRQNGDLFDRLPVQVIYEDKLNVVLASDSILKPGMYVAQNSAASLNRVLKAQNASGGLPPGAHFHADGSLHIPGQ